MTESESPMFLPSLQWVFEKLEPWIRAASISEKKALDLFLDALNATQVYLGKISVDKSKANKKEEAKLSKAWNKAAKAARVHDDDLYRRCLAKACHWSGSRDFEQTDIANIDTSISKMIQIAIEKGV